MKWTPEQRAVIEHPLDAHAVVRAVPGAGKTTTLVGRVEALVAKGVAPARIRVVMFNKSIQEHFTSRLEAAGVSGVKVTTFDALGLEVLRAAQRFGRRYEVDADGTNKWARAVWPAYREHIETAEEVANAVSFWKAHLVSPARAAFPSNPAYVAAYRDFEAVRTGEGIRVGFEDMVRTAVGVLGQHPRLLGVIDHMLVDEFQDVNPGRVELLLRLSHPGTSVMAVGDEDQGVNEWCGAHPRFFRNFADLFSALPTRTYPLTRSFRFGANIATAANRVIRHNVERAPAVVVGGGQTAGVVREVDDIGGTVLRLLADGWEASDIAVLYRSRTQGAAALAALAAVRVPLLTDDIALLTRGRGPDLALAYLRYATSDAPVTFDEVWPVVFAPDRYIQKEAFGKQVARHGANGLRAVLRDRILAQTLGQGRGALNSLTELLRTLDSMGRAATAGKALDRLLAEVDVEAQLRARLRSEKDQDMAIATFHAVHALLHGLKVPPADAATALETLDPTFGKRVDACVWASTIHKAKGLVALRRAPRPHRGRVPRRAPRPDPRHDRRARRRRREPVDGAGTPHLLRRPHPRHRPGAPPRAHRLPEPLPRRGQRRPARARPRRRKAAPLRARGDAGAHAHHHRRPPGRGRQTVDRRRRRPPRPGLGRGGDPRVPLRRDVAFHQRDRRAPRPHRRHHRPRRGPAAAVGPALR